MSLRIEIVHMTENKLDNFFKEVISWSETVQSSERIGLTQRSRGCFPPRTFG